ncbi:MAG: helix-turn-helix domain-containing protein, partial [Coriobacteriia bacterium]|nr:helix-turn-helix domain-containing protein [Coriobacteriia bacterium]
EVSSVTVAELPDIAQWLTGNDFVHCVGRLFADKNGDIDEKRFYQWVIELINHGAACLAVKTHRYIKSIPQSIRSLGDKTGFPIIELPNTMMQSKVAEVIYEMILQQGQERERKRTRLFTDMVRSLTGPHVLENDAEHMQEALGYPIMIVSKNFKPLATSSGLNRKTDAHINAICEAIEQAVRKGDKIEELTVGCSQELYDYYTHDLSGNPKRLIVASILYKYDNLGYVCMIGNSKDAMCDPIYFFASLAEVLTIDMSQNVMIETSILMTRSKFFSTISAPEFDEKLASHLMNLIGLDPVLPLRIAVINMGCSSRNFAPEYAFFGETEKKAINFAQQYLNSTLFDDELHFISAWERGFAIIFQGERRSKDQLSELVADLVEALSVTLDMNGIIAGIGKSGTGVEGAHFSSETAFYAMKCIETFSLKDNVVLYDKLGTYLFLSTALNSPVASRNYVNYVLGPLLEDSEYSEDLLDTLLAYMNANGSYAQASKALMVHVNTVRYRISKISDLLPIDINTLDGRGAIWLATKIYAFLQSSNPDLTR